MYTVEKRLSASTVAEYKEQFEHFQIAQSAALTWCVDQQKPHRILLNGQPLTPWFNILETDHTRHLEILQNELLTYTQASTVRLQALVDLFGDMVQDKPDDPEKHVRRVDALAEMIRNQLAELQVLTQPIGGGK